MDIEQLTKDIEAAGPWFYKMELMPGVFTPGGAEAYMCRRYGDIYLSNVSGKTVLDIGAWDGQYSFDAESRGAKRVVACDHYCWGNGGPGNRKAFELARRILKSNVEDVILDIPNISEATVGRFDLVLYNGIFYHVLDPVHQLQVAASVCDETLTLETLMGARHFNEPAMVYFGGDIRAGVPGRLSWGWGPNLLLLFDLFTVLGFVAVEYYPSPAAPLDRCIIKGHRRDDLANPAHVITRAAIPAISAGLAP